MSKQETKTAEEILNSEFNIKLITKNHNYDYLYNSALKAMETYASQFKSKECYSREEKAFIEGYKTRAMISDLQFDEISINKAKECFKEWIKNNNHAGL